MQLATAIYLAAIVAKAQPDPLPVPVTQPLPFPYTGYEWFPAFYFGSRPEGLQTEPQLELMANYSMVGCASADLFLFCRNYHAAEWDAAGMGCAGGWEQGLGAGCETCNGWKATGPLDELHYCSSEQRLSESATRFRSYLQWGPPSHDPLVDPTTKPIFVYRNFVLSLHFYSIQRASYSQPELFLRNSAGDVCLHSRNGSPFWCACVCGVAIHSLRVSPLALTLHSLMLHPGISRIRMPALSF
eukprot:COSAG02_NODE_5531_length_4252_cov_2.279316_2_plen_243_part_00